jgi:peptidyl-prolyl cis-trans isomerase A (cyclophilin A)
MRGMRNFSCSVLAAAVLLTPIAGAFAQAPASTPEAKAEKKAEHADKKAEKKSNGKDTYATFETSAGNIVVKLLPATAPKAVENFTGLAEGKKEWTDPLSNAKVKKPLYDSTLFHRVIPGFMIQGGDPLTKDAAKGAVEKQGRPFGTGGPGYKFEDELKDDPAPFAKTCQLAMANSGPNTNGSQFFITEGFGEQVLQLNPRPCESPGGLCGYTHFGEGICGCDLVRKIAMAGNSNTHLKKVKITRGKAPDCK